MSGEITVTPAIAWTNQDVTHARLAQTAAPSARVDAGAIGSREVDAAAMTALLASSVRGVNLFRNSNFWKDSWELGAGLSAPVAARTFNAASWFVRPTGAVVTYLRDEETRAGAEYNLDAAKVRGATGATTVEFGQYVPAKLAASLAAGEFTISFQIKNLTNAAVVPKVYLNISTSQDAEESVVTDAAPDTLTSVGNGDWAKLEATRDGTALPGIERGFELVVQIPSGNLDDVAKEVIFAQMQLEPGSAATTFVLPRESGWGRNARAATVNPAVTDDVSLGYEIGSRWVNVTAAREWMCISAAAGAAVWKMTSNPDFAQMNYQELSGVAGQTFAAGYNTCALNGISYNDATIVTQLLTNAFTLEAGIYEVDAHVAGAADTELLRITDGVTTYAYNTKGGRLRGRMISPGGVAYQLQIYSVAGFTQTARSLTVNEIYNELNVQRVG